MNAKMKAILNVVIVAVVSVALLFGMSAITDTLVKRQEDEAAKIAFGDILNADRLEAIATKDTEGITSAYKALDKNGALIGYAVTATVKGYGGDMAVHVALTPDGSEFIGLRVGSHMETEGYGLQSRRSRVHRPLCRPESPGFSERLYRHRGAGRQRRHFLLSRLLPGELFPLLPAGRHEGRHIQSGGNHLYAGL